MPHAALTPEMVAEADRIHASGRDLLNSTAKDYLAHRDGCDDTACRREEVAVACMSSELFAGITECGHPECLTRNVQQLCEAVAYAAVRTAENRPLTRQEGK